MTSSIIDILMSLQCKYNLFENLLTIDKISFAFVSLTRVELHLDVENIGHAVRMPISGYRCRRYKASEVSTCCVLEQDTLSAFFQSTQLWRECQMRTPL